MRSTQEHSTASVLQDSDHAPFDSVKGEKVDDLIASMESRIKQTHSNEIARLQGLQESLSKALSQLKAHRQYSREVRAERAEQVSIIDNSFNVEINGLARQRSDMQDRVLRKMDAPLYTVRKLIAEESRARLAAQESFQKTVCKTTTIIVRRDGS